MTGWKRALAWVSAVLIGLLLVGLGGYLAVTDLDRADKLASVVGVFLGLAGLALSVYGVIVARRRPSVEPGRQNVARVDARDGIDIVDTVAGDVRLGTPPASGSAPRTADPVPPKALGEQSVTDVRSGGHVRIVRGVGGDVDSAP